MKKIISVLLSAVMVAGIFTSLPVNSFAAKKKAKPVSLKKTSVTLKISEKNGKKVYGTTKIKVKKAKGVKIKKTTYKSLNKGIAKVSKKGKVTAKAHGNTKIKVKVKYKYKKRSYKKTLTLKVKVKSTITKMSYTSETPAASTEEQTTAAPPSEANPIETTEPVENTTAKVEPTAPSEDKTEPDETSSEKPAATEPTTAEVTNAPDETIEKDTEPFSVQPYTRATDAIIEIEETTESATNSNVEPKSRALNTVDLPDGSEAGSFKDENFIKKLTNFSDKLYNMASKDEDGNYTISPVSVYMALAMLYEVGDDGVKSDIKELAEMDENDINKTGALFKSLINKITVSNFNGDIDVGKVDLTNSIWIDDNETADEQTLKTLAEKLYCYAFEAPFKNDNQAANSAIRKFIKEQTNGLIDKDFDINETTVFSLINTLYFKDVWSLEDELSTKDDYFVTDNGIKKCEFIKGKYLPGKIQETESCYYFYTTTEAGYKVKLILPKDGYTLAQAMSKDNLNTVNSDKDFDIVDDQKTSHSTRCVFPSFKVESDTPFDKVFLENNALNNAFSLFYSPLFKDRPFQVSEIKHSAVVDANKKGVEGAAVTIISAKEDSAPIDENPVMYHTLTLNRNFGFIITDPSDVILFEGQVKDPKPDKAVIPEDDLDFSISFNNGGESSYNSKTKVLTKTEWGYIKRTPEEYKTLLVLNDEQKAVVKEALDSININDYPDSYNPFEEDKNYICSVPSESVSLRIGNKTVVCNDISYDSISENDKGKKFMTAVSTIKKVIKESSEWKSLPELEVLID